ncbi:ATP-binding cassette domain-containing protein [Caenimonas sedimenti]|uniref:ATP-binding cassette domain-containing protein n=1 Tax=Caenimonas sedimenti TaxID=2596921 RepID=A0A562ZSB5_9BURK|nr:ATPase, T2SS/T4P/T4SS family [Caenimonas sedimenti]TWO71423.1 ATP-binding cassette domain-containing protein [Caenimonas sedimenti]
MTASVAEINLPKNKRSGLAGVLWACRTFAPSITDILIKEGEPIRAKSARGVVPLSELHVPNADLPIGADEIRYFMAHFVDRLSPNESANDHWKANYAPSLSKRLPVYRTMELSPDKPGDPVPHLRLSLYLQGRGRLALIARPVLTPPALDTLALPKALVHRLRSAPKGLLILTGPTGAGKTTTAYSILEELKECQSGHIVTIEDPIERPLDSARSIVTQREVGEDVNSFGDGLYEALRQSPDVILAGEVRDEDAGAAAILGGQSGALMIATMHGMSIQGTLDKLLSLGGGEAKRTMLAGSLLAILRLELVPYLDGSKYALVHEALMGTDEVCLALRTGDVKALKNIMSSPTDSESFYPMSAQIQRLVGGRVVAPEAAGRADGLQRGRASALR